MFYTYITLPADLATSTIAQAAAWFNPLFTDFWPIAAIAIGVGLFFSIMAWIVSHFHIGGNKDSHR